jgi:signal transduction histidine kinase
VFGALRSWLGQRQPRVVDVLVTVAVVLLTLAFALRGLEDRILWGVAFILAGSLPLLFRRRWPFAVLAVVSVMPVLAPVDLPLGLAMVVALYTVGTQRSWRATLAASGAVLVAALVYSLAGGSRIDGGAVVALALLCAVGAGLGLYIGGKRTSITSLEGLAREQQLLAERAVAEERVRIAQELHDVIAHNVSLIVVQAQALGATHGDERVKGATEGIADLGRRTMAEMHRTLRLLRARDDGPELAPQPGLGDLDELLARSRAAGLPVELAVEGAPRRLAQSVDLSAFRIVQEALTNVVKHAGRARTAVTIAYGPEALELTIVDSGGGARSERPAPGGHGLIGMRERTALFGGTLTAGPRSGDGFEVRALLPYDERIA